MKMTPMIAALLFAGLAGCAGSVETAGPEQVSITYINLLEGPDALQPRAEAACAEAGRQAVYRGSTLGEGALGLLTGLPLTASFACIAADGAS